MPHFDAPFCKFTSIFEPYFGPFKMVSLLCVIFISFQSCIIPCYIFPITETIYCL